MTDVTVSLDDLRAVRNGHESECAWYEGGDFICSCPHDEAAERVDAILDEADAAARRDWERDLWMANLARTNRRA